MVEIPGMGWAYGPVTDEELGWEPQEDTEYLDYLAGAEPGPVDWIAGTVPQEEEK